MPRCEVTDLLTIECAHCQKLDTIPLRDCRPKVRQTTAKIVQFPAMEEAALGTKSYRESKRIRAHRPGDNFMDELRKAREMNQRFEQEAREGWKRGRIAQWQARLDAAIAAGASAQDVKIARNYIRLLISQPA